MKLLGYQNKHMKSRILFLQILKKIIFSTIYKFEILYIKIPLSPAAI